MAFRTTLCEDGSQNYFFENGLIITRGKKEQSENCMQHMVLT